MINNINFNIQDGALGFASGNKDVISALISYHQDYATDVALLTFPASQTNWLKCTKLSDATKAGILSTNAFNKEYYQISEFFRMNPRGVLYVNLYEYTPGLGTPTPIDYTVAIDDVMLNSKNEIRQIGVHNPNAVLSTAVVSTLNNKALLLEAANTPVDILYAASTATFTIATLPDFSNLGKFVTVIVGVDYVNAGTALEEETTLGATLGAVSNSVVSESIGWVEKFNFSDGFINETPAIYLLNPTNPESVKVGTIDVTDIETLLGKKVMFLDKIAGYNGSYYAVDMTCANELSDYKYLHLTRTMNKVLRVSFLALVPNLNMPLVLKSGGKLTDATIMKFTDDINKALEKMKGDGEISDYRVFIDPDQIVISNNTVYVDVAILPIGFANFINVNLGYTVTI